jgi:hypothetical protein
MDVLVAETERQLQSLCRRQPRDGLPPVGPKIVGNRPHPFSVAGTTESLIRVPGSGFRVPIRD